MRFRSAVKLSFKGVVIGLLAGALVACGGSSSSSGRTAPGTAPLSGGGIKGPIANGAATLSIAQIAGGEVTAGAQVATGNTGATGLVELDVEDGQPGPFLLVIDGTLGTDISTGQAPAIPVLKTIVTRAQVDSGEPVFASLLSTIAADIAAAGATTPAELEAGLPLASVQVLQTLGFGADAGIDLFATPLILTENVTTFAQTQNVVALRKANEATGAAILLAAGAPATVLDKIADDIAADGMLDEDIGAGADADLAGFVNAITMGVDEATNLPGATMGEDIAGVQADVDAETATTGVTPSATAQSIVQSATSIAPLVPPMAGMLDVSGNDLDADGTPNDMDAFPGDPDGQTDANDNGVPDELEGNSDGDTIIDADDNCPNDDNENQLDGDGDGFGDVCDDFPADPVENTNSDSDSIGDNGDNCPLVDNETQDDLDNDGLGNVCDNDADGDGADGDGMGGASANDVNDLDNTVAIDPDSDGIDSSPAAGTGTLNGPDNCPNDSNPGQEDLDTDGAGNACDLDADGDGANGDGAGGPSGTDVDDLDNTVAIDPDSDGIDSSPAAGTGTLNGPDNCPNASNPGQEDLDTDGAGNVCDLDADGDGANGDGMGGPSVTDEDDLDGSYAIDADDDLIDDNSGAGSLNGPDNCLGVANPGQEDLDLDGAGNVCDLDADGDGANGDGMGGPSVNDDNDLDANVISDPDSDGVDTNAVGTGPDNCPLTANPGQELTGTSVAVGDACDPDDDDVSSDADGSPNSPDNCPNDANPGQADADMDGDGDACDDDSDNDGIRDALDPAPSSATQDYHFDLFYLQQSSEAGRFKLATINESSLQDDGSVDSASSNLLDLGTDNMGDGTFDVTNDYQTSEASIDFASGAGFGGATPTTVNNAVVIMADDTGNNAAYSEPNLDFTDAPAFSMVPWGITNFIGSGRVALAGVGSTLTTSGEQSLAVLSFTDGLGANADLSGTYGVIDLDVSYGSANTGNALVSMQSRVTDLTLDGGGLVTAAGAMSQFNSAVGTGDGSLTFSSTAFTGGTFAVAGDGSVDLVAGGDTYDGFADAAGDLVTLSDQGNNTLRGYAVKLGSPDIATLVAEGPYDLQGLSLASGNSAITGSSLNGATISFADAGSGNITASINLGGAATTTSTIDGGDAALPTTAAGAPLSGVFASLPFTMDANGRFSLIEFGGSNIELEGFFVPGKGVFLRYIDGLNAAVSGGGGGPAGPGLEFCSPNGTPPDCLDTGGTPGFIALADPPFNGATPQVCVGPGTPGNCTLRDVTDGDVLVVALSNGQIVVGVWTSLGGGGGSTDTKLSQLARDNTGVGQVFTTIAGQANTTLEGDSVTQGILFGTPSPSP